MHPTRPASALIRADESLTSAVKIGRCFLPLISAIWNEQDPAAALYQRRGDLLVDAAAALGPMLFLPLPADIGLMDINRLTLAAHRRWVKFAHALTDAMRHEPCRLVRNA